MSDLPSVPYTSRGSAIQCTRLSAKDLILRMAKFNRDQATILLKRADQLEKLVSELPELSTDADEALWLSLGDSK